MRFVYKAKKDVKHIVEGTIEADNKEEALNKLSARGLFPVAIEAFSVASPSAQPSLTKKIVRKFALPFRKRVSSGQLLVFTQKLTTLVRSKVELLSALKIIYEQTDNAAFKGVILEIYNATREGKTFSQSLGRYPDIFPHLFVSIIRSGEASGSLEAALEQIGQFLNREQAIRTKVALALAYPSLLLFVGLMSIFVLINFVIPKLKPVFANVGGELPLVTKIVFQISSISYKSWIIALAVVAALIFLVRVQKGTVFFTRLARTIKTRLPLVKRVIRNQELAHFSHSLSLLLRSGVTPLRSLEIVSTGVQDPRLGKELKEVCAQVAAGRSLSQSIAALTILPSFFTKMVAIGEESGRLSEVLEEVAHSYTQQLETDIALMGSLLEPALIFVLGIILGTIVISILIPIFQITQMVQ